VGRRANARQRRSAALRPSPTGHAADASAAARVTLTTIAERPSSGEALDVSPREFLEVTSRRGKARSRPSCPSRKRYESI
jgi:hypothetical protein